MLRTVWCICVVALVFLMFVSGPATTGETDSNLVASGERLVQLMDCNVCHTPKTLTPEGPRPDPARLLSGHPHDEKLPAVPEGLIGPAGWGGVFNQGLTAWAGPWGISYGTNLTPDETGIGGWTEEDFTGALRTGMHVEEGRPFLPPMPTYSHLTDEEIHAIFAYLRSLPPVRNDVPGAVVAAGPPANK